MRRYGYWQAIALSFYSRDFYRDVRQNWGANVILYLFLVLTLGWLPLLYALQIKMNRELPPLVQAIGPQFPIVTIKNGIVSTPENKPYFIKDAKQKQLLAIIDTSGHYTNLDKTPANFLVTKSTLVSRTKDAVKVQTISTNFSAVLDPTALSQRVLTFSQWLWIVLLPLFLLISGIYRLMESAVYAVIGKLYTVVTKFPEPKLTYASILKLTIVALTPVIFVNTIVASTVGSFPYQFALYFVIVMYYLYFAIKANRTKGLPTKI